MKALFDTHILIDYLCGRVEAKREIERYEAPMVSAVTASELLAAATPQELPVVEAFLKRFEVVACDRDVAARAAQLRQRYGLSMESSLIWACAKASQALFVTRSEHYPAEEAGLRYPY